MRRYRPLLALPAVSAMFIAAGPFVGTAHAANVSFTGSTPPDGSVATAAPAQVSATFSEAVNPTTLPGTRHSSIAITYLDNNSTVTCTPGGGSGSSTASTLTCAPAAPLADGMYKVSGIAWATNSLDGGVNYSFNFTVDASSPALQAGSRTPTPSSSVQSKTAGSPVVSAIYDVPLNTDSSTITVRNKFGSAVAGTKSFATSNRQISWTPSDVLTEAGNPYAVTVAAVDIAGGHPTTTTKWSFTIDNTAPNPPIYTVPSFVNLSNRTNFPVSGTAEARSTVTLIASNSSALAAPVVTATALADSNGAWAVSNFNLSSLTDGPVYFGATAADSAGNVSDSAQTSAAKDTSAPTAPTVKYAPSTVNVLNGSTMVVSGAADLGNGIAVAITDGTHTVNGAGSSGAADGNGDTYSVGGLDVSSLNDGTVTITVTATETSGNTASTVKQVTKDTVAPGAPTSLALQSPINAGNYASRQITGTADPTATEVDITVSDSANPAKTDSYTVTPAGDHTFAKTVSLLGYVDGPITVSAVDKDANGNLSTAATTSALKDTAPPSAPTAVVPAYVNIANKAAVPVSGTAEPGSTVTIQVNDTGSGVVTQTAAVDQTGNWSQNLDVHSLADGPVTYTITATDPSGNTSDPTVIDNQNHKPTSKKDTIAPNAPTGVAFAHSPVTTSATVTGHGVDGDTITVTISSDSGPGTASNTSTDGNFSISVDVSGLADGTLTATATDTDAAGNTSAASTISAAATATKDTTTVALVSASPVDGSLVQNGRPISMTFNEQLDQSHSTLTLKDAANDTVATGNATLSVDKKTISVLPTDSQLPDGTYTFSAKVTDLSNNEQNVTSPTVEFTVDHTAPGVPTDLSLGNATVANSALVPVSGTAAETGGTVTITVADSTGATAQPKTIDVGADPNWSTTVDVSSLAEGALSATAIQTDAAGNASDSSTPATATKDTVAPVAPVVNVAGPARADNYTNVPVSGTGTDGDTEHVTLTDGTTTRSHDVTVAAGQWSTAFDTTEFAEGQLTLAVTELDGVGNASSVTQQTFTKDTAAPIATMTTPTSKFTTSTTIGVSWTGSDSGSGLTSYDVRYRRASTNGDFAGYVYPSPWQATSATSNTLTGAAAGYDYCFSVRARDSAGNVSDWSTERCTALPLDDRALAASGATWSRATNSTYYLGTYTQSSTQNDTLTRSSVQGDRFELIATRCSTCGQVEVYVGGTLLKTIDLTNSSTQTHWHYSWATTSLVSGQLVIKVISPTGDMVRIDGFGVSRT